MSRSRLAVLATATLLAGSLLGACGQSTEVGDGGSRDSVPITQRAIAALALENLPTRTTSRAATSTEAYDAAGVLGADLRYDGGGGSDGGLLRVLLLPPGPDLTCADQEGRCESRTVADGTLVLSWELAEPEEDPGLVDVSLQREDGEVVRVAWFGDTITGDPRDQPLAVSLEAMEAVAQDSRLSLTTTAEVVALGAALDDWDGGEPDPHARDRVPSTDQGLLNSYLLAHGGYSSWSGFTSSPLKADLGGGAIGGRMVREGDADVPEHTVDVLASPTGPAFARGGDPCAAYAGECRDEGRGRFFAWTPGPEGEVWMIGVRGEEVVAIRVSGLDVPRSQEQAKLVSDWYAEDTYLLDDTLGLSTDQEVLDFVP